MGGGSGGGPQTIKTPWDPVQEYIGQLLINQLGQPGGGPVYPGVMRPGMSPASLMSMQLMNARAGGPMRQNMNPFAQQGYQTGMLGGGAAPQGMNFRGGGGPPMTPQGQGGQGGGALAPPWLGAGPGRVDKGFQELMSILGPHTTAAMNPYRAWGGHSPSSKANLWSPVIKGGFPIKEPGGGDSITEGASKRPRDFMWQGHGEYFDPRYFHGHVPDP